MSRSGKYLILCAGIWFVVSTVYFSHRASLNLQLLSAAAACLFLAAIIVSIAGIAREWRRSRWLSVVPFAVCILLQIVCIPIVRTIRQGIFLRSLPSYEAVVRQMESGSIPVSRDLSQVPQAVSLAHLALAVLAQKDTNGVMTVEFLTEGGYPLKHSGYMYISSGVVEEGSMEDLRWPIRREIRPRWFYISD